MLEQQVDLEGSRRIWFPDEQVELSFDETRRAAGAVAAVLSAHGVFPGSTIGIVMQNEASSVVAVLGAWRYGCTVVSLPPVPKHVAAAELYSRHYGAVLALLGCEFAFGGSRLSAALPSVRVVVPSVSDAMSASTAQPIPDVALVQFTSGTTGPPQGVAISKRALSGHLAAIAGHLEMTSGRDTVATWLPLCHDMGFVGFLLTTLAARCDLVLRTPATFIRNPRSWLRDCTEARATITGAPDFAYRMVSRSMRRGAGGVLDLRSLRCVMCGGEPVSPHTLREFHSITQDQGLAWDALMPVYGMAEATLAVTMPPLRRGPVVVDGGSSVLNGSPLPGVAVSTVGPEPSTVAIKSDWLMDAHVTLDGVRPPTLADGWFLTGDVGRVVDGELAVFGRRDGVVVVNGRNIHPEDVEALGVVVGHGDIHAAAAYAGEAGIDLICEVGVRDAGSLSRLAGELRSAISASLGIRLGRLSFCRPLSLPRTTSGKVIRAACAASVTDGKLRILHVA